MYPSSWKCEGYVAVIIKIKGYVPVKLKIQGPVKVKIQGYVSAKVILGGKNLRLCINKTGVWRLGIC